MVIDYKSIGGKIRASRIRRGMKQWQLAEKTGMSNVYISYIETGTKRPSLNAILKIGKVLCVSIDSLVRDDWAISYIQCWLNCPMLIKQSQV